MHPLSTFPALLTYGFFAPTILRLGIGFLRLMAGVDRKNKDYGWTSIFYIVSSIMIVVGFYTQIAVIIALILIALDFWLEKKKGPVAREKMALTILMIIILLSLLLTGPGAFAFDLPL